MNMPTDVVSDNRIGCFFVMSFASATIMAKNVAQEG